MKSKHVVHRLSFLAGFCNAANTGMTLLISQSQRQKINVSPIDWSEFQLIQYNIQWQHDKHVLEQALKNHVVIENSCLINIG